MSSDGIELSSTTSPHPGPSSIVWPQASEGYNEVDYVGNSSSVEEYERAEYAHDFKTEPQDGSPVVNYVESSTSLASEAAATREAYEQLAMHTYGEASTSADYCNSPGSTNEACVRDAQFNEHSNNSPQNLIASESHSSRSQTPVLHPSNVTVNCPEVRPSEQEAQISDSSFERLHLSLESPIAFQIRQDPTQGMASLGLPVVLDRNNLATLIASAREPSIGLDLMSIQRYLLSSQGRLVVDNHSAYVAGAEPMGVPHASISPMLAQRDILNSIITSSASVSGHSSNLSIPVHHKHMLVQKYHSELDAPSVSSSSPEDLRHQAVLDHLAAQSASPFSTSSEVLYDTQSPALYSAHHTVATSLANGLDVYGLDRGASLVSSTRDSPEDFIEHGLARYSPGPSTSRQSHVQNYVSSTIEADIHSSVDSSVERNLASTSEGIVDSTESYCPEIVHSPEEGLHTTTNGVAEDYCPSEEASSSRSSVPVSLSQNIVDSSEALTSTTGSLLTVQEDGSRLGNLQSGSVCNAQPDSTHSPLSLSVERNYLAAFSEVYDHAESSRPKRDLRTGRHWCEECQHFYEKDCPHHRIQLIYDKPVLSRAWASLPATYLYVNNVAITKDADPVYGVFAKKTIPKRTQFGPIEGIIIKEDDLSPESFPLVIDKEDSTYMLLDTSDESFSNWMRFVRPASSHKEQNLVLVELSNSLYFNTTRAINPKTELRVWYSNAYAEKWGLPLLELNEDEKKALEELENAWPCFECSRRFTTSEELQKHLNQHDEEISSVPGPSGSVQKLKGRVKAVKKTRGRPPKPKVFPDFVELVDDLAAKRPRGRPRKKVKDEVEEEKPAEGPSTATENVELDSSKPKIPGQSGARQEEYQCDLCNKSFPRNYSLQRHLIMHSGEKKYKCPICDMKFSHVYNRNRHVRRHRQQQQKEEAEATKNLRQPLFRRKRIIDFFCSHCHLTFVSSSLLNLHLLSHIPENDASYDDSVFQNNAIQMMKQDLALNGMQESEEVLQLVCDTYLRCPECTQEFETKKELIEHAGVHGKTAVKIRTSKGGIVNPLKPYKCNLCYKSFAAEDRLVRHYQVHGSEDSKPLQCNVCFKRFLNNSALSCHVKVHSDDRKFYECPICKEEFAQIVTLKEHVHNHCQGGLYTCPTCDKEFEEYNQIRKHIRAFHSERKYPCNQCEKVFPRPDKLKLHMLRHSDHREFLCANCGKQFKRKDKLKEHMKRMHAPEREARKNAFQAAKLNNPKKFIPKVSPTDYHRFIYKCHTCLLGFKRRGMLVNHLAKRHPNIRPESVPELNLPILKTTRDYYCQYCEKVYKSSSKRKAHILKYHPGAELPMSNRRKINH